LEDCHHAAKGTNVGIGIAVEGHKIGNLTRLYRTDIGYANGFLIRRYVWQLFAQVRRQ
jgi:hypothetical protein